MFLILSMHTQTRPRFNVPSKQQIIRGLTLAVFKYKKAKLDCWLACILCTPRPVHILIDVVYVQHPHPSHTIFLCSGVPLQQRYNDRHNTNIYSTNKKIASNFWLLHFGGSWIWARWVKHLHFPLYPRQFVNRALCWELLRQGLPQSVTNSGRCWWFTEKEYKKKYNDKEKNVHVCFRYDGQK